MSLCVASRRMLATRAYKARQTALRFPEIGRAAPLAGERLVGAARKRLSAALCDFGPSTFWPVESVASVVTPRSTPTRSMGCATGFMSSVSTMTEANHRSPSRETVTRLSGPENRAASRILTQPITGSLICSPSCRRKSLARRPGSPLRPGVVAHWPLSSGAPNRSPRPPPAHPQTKAKTGHGRDIGDHRLGAFGRFNRIASAHAKEERSRPCIRCQIRTGIS